ncbi:hypothetical protein CHARACLAT_009577 [Characodon lateralis]|uniref:Uncharacterized protein n=1 Tax=Characodon lateralis TaxID=208331 RepID=A0ABU7EHQ2_9TELE|nr:hypothetical protein [Characodon lateralis]
MRGADPPPTTYAPQMCLMNHCTVSLNYRHLSYRPGNMYNTESAPLGLVCFILRVANSAPQECPTCVRCVSAPKQLN